MQGRQQWNVFKLLKEKVNRRFYTQKKRISKTKIKQDFFKLSNFKGKRIHHQQTIIIRNVKGNSLGQRKILLEGNTDLHKGRKSTGNSNYMGKCLIFFLFFKYIKKTFDYINRNN